jgi:hypothetical protein
MLVTSRVITSDNPEWDRWLQPVPHDFYHTAGYHRMHELESNSPARLFVYGTPSRFFAWPYLLSPIPDSIAGPERELYDVTSVYGYPGPLAHGCADDDSFLQAGWEALIEHWKSESVVSVFSRFHPILENYSFLERESHRSGLIATNEASGVRYEGQTVSIDLTEGEEGIWKQCRPMFRRHITKAKRCGIVTEADKDWVYLDDFVRLYHATMTRNHAAARYFFDRDHVEHLRDSASPHISLHVARMNDETACAVLASEFDGVAQYLYAGVNEEFSAYSPLKVLLHHIACAARANGNRALHLGGGRDAQDGDTLFYFKSGFSDRRHRFCTGRWILNPRLYAELSADAAPSNFFPAYRSRAAKAQPEIPTPAAVSAI